jgi:5-formyltetrahydrofolate cyclo-ligase
MIEKRKSMPKEEVMKNSRIIKDRLFNLSEYRNARNVLFYVSYDNEVFTHEMVKDALSDENKNVFVPITDMNKRQIIVSQLFNWDDLEPGAYGILEPREKKIVSQDKIDIVIVPGIAFDLRGHRIGHGIGYYDKLLKKMSDYTSIGLAFEKQILQRIPNREYDVAVDIIITEKRIIRPPILIK